MYLSGPIEFGQTENWRIAPTKVLTEEFGINVFDPFSDPKQQWVPILKEAQATKDYGAIVDVTKRFVNKDLLMVDRADFVVAYVPHKVPTTGTVHEIINSNNSKKPTLLVSSTGDISQIPLWYFGFIPLEFMFPTWDALYSYLRELDTGNTPKHKRWSYVLNKI